MSGKARRRWQDRMVTSRAPLPRIGDRRFIVHVGATTFPVYEEVQAHRVIREHGRKGSSAGILRTETLSLVGWMPDADKMPQWFAIVPAKSTILPVCGIGRDQLARIIRMWRRVAPFKIKRAGRGRFQFFEMTTNGRQLVAEFKGK